MSGWVPMPVAVWPQVRPAPNAGGSRTGPDGSTQCGPWTDEVVAFDMRWEYDQTGRLPSRGALAKRWGWTRDEVRTALRHPERWWDALKGPMPSSRDDLTQSDPPRPSLTQSDPAMPQRVDPPPPSPSHPQILTVRHEPARPLLEDEPTAFDLTPPPSRKPAAPRAPSRIDTDYERVCDYVVSTFGPATGLTRTSRPNRATPRGKAILSAIRTDVEQALDALRWVAEGPDPWNRDRREPRCTVEYVLQRRDEYADLWRDHSSAPARASPPQYAAPSPVLHGSRPFVPRGST